MTNFVLVLLATAALSSLFLFQPPPVMFVGVALITANLGAAILFAYCDLKMKLEKYVDRGEKEVNNGKN